MKLIAVLALVPLVAAAQPARYRSRISICDLADKSVRVIYTSDQVFEAPNWSRDGKYLLSNSGGNLYRIPVAGSATPEKAGIDPDLRCNNDHDYSPDGKLLAISASSPKARGSQVYVVSADGSNPRQMTTVSPSYFHGWSPDGKWLAMVAQRSGNFDLFRIPVTGGPEQRLTSSPGYDDGPDYSPDGKWIYFNSDRSKGWDIWRMPPDGAGPNDAKAEQVTRDELEDWFPHPSPNGKWLVFLSFPKGTTNHNGKMDIQLRMIPLPGKKVKPGPIQVVTKLFGGQGTINVNSWSPDSKRFAFVSYEPL
jgi:Tol biopolymer transport system component